MCFDTYIKYALCAFVYMMVDTMNEMRFLGECSPSSGFCVTSCSRFSQSKTQAPPTGISKVI